MDQKKYFRAIYKLIFLINISIQWVHIICMNQYRIAEDLLNDPGIDYAMTCACVRGT